MSDLLAQLRAYGEQIENERSLGGQEPEDENLVQFGGGARGRLSDRRWLVAAAVGLIGVLVLGLLLLALRNEPSVPADDPNPASIVTDGWTVFERYRDASTLKDVDVYRVRNGEAPVAVHGADTVGFDEVCPTLSPGGDRLAFVARSLAASGNERVVVAALVGDGRLAERREFERPSTGTGRDTQCPTWSRDGRRLGWIGPNGVTVVDIASGATTEVALPDPVRDFEWAPDGDRFAVSSDRIRIFAGAAEGFTLDADLTATTDATYLSWAGDGTRIAYFAPSADNSTGTDEAVNLRIIDVATREVLTLGEQFASIHGFGPVWSPVNDEIVYQRVCAGRDAGASTVPCREEHEVVIVTPDDVESVLPELATPGQPAHGSWWPFGVTWTPDGDALLYLAWGNNEPATTGLVLRPVHSPDSEPQLLAEGPDLAVYTGSRFDPWGG